jgi:hypothetical protein
MEKYIYARHNIIIFWKNIICRKNLFKIVSKKIYQLPMNKYWK